MKVSFPTLVALKNSKFKFIPNINTAFLFQILDCHPTLLVTFVGTFLPLKTLCYV